MNLQGILADWQIRELVIKHRMIEPFAEGVREPGVISFGIDSYGYDFRLSPEIWIFSDITTGGGIPLDPKAFDERLYIHRELNGPYALPPHGFILGKSVEYFRIPRDIMVIGAAKTTYARSGILVQTTPLNPEWEGVLMLSISNVSPHPIFIYPGEGIGKLLFFRAAEPCATSYLERKGKYQSQKEIIGPRV